MDHHPPPTVCRLLGASVRGAAHTRRGEPCQDALGWWPVTAAGPPAAIAVADGHGSPASFRSGTGARFAVDAALAVLARFAEAFAASPPSLIKRAAEERLPLEVVRDWVERVRQHAAAEPFTAGELATLDEKGGPPARRKFEANPLLPYGTTLLAAGVFEAGIVFLHLGDGDILAVGPDGEPARPVSRDERAFADETPSLCQLEAWRDFRVGFRAAAGGTPAMVLLATDGYANCFASDEDFCRVGPDLLAAVRHRGPDRAEADLVTHLEEATRRYSGDDITVGLVWFPGVEGREQPCSA